MATDRALLKFAQVGQVGGLNLVDPDGTVGLAHSRAITANISDAATAGTAVTESVIYRAPAAGVVKAAYYATPVGVAGNDTTFATFTLSKRTGGGAPVVVASQNTKITGGAGSAVAFVPVPLVLVGAAVQLAAGDVLTIAVAKASTGVAISAATSTAGITVLLEEN